MTKVLIVSNDQISKNATGKILNYNGFTVETASDSVFAWKHLQEIRFDFIMIDMKLSQESGLGFYKALRQVGNNIPIMMIGESALDAFMLKDLSNENYDYMIKPLKFSEMQTKINAFLEQNKSTERLLSFGELKVDCRQQLIIFRDRLLQLNRVELDIIVMLAQKGGQALHPKKMTKLIDKGAHVYNMTTFFYVSKLRKKLQKFGWDSLDIIFIKDQGYKLTFS